MISLIYFFLSNFILPTHPFVIVKSGSFSSSRSPMFLNHCIVFSDSLWIILILRIWWTRNIITLWIKALRWSSASTVFTSLCCYHFSSVIHISCFSLFLMSLMLHFPVVARNILLLYLSINSLNLCLLHVIIIRMIIINYLLSL